MKVRNKNPLAKELIRELQAKGLKTPVWKAVAKGLNRPRRKTYEVDVFRLEKHVKKGEHVIVPGTVLGTGELSKPLTVAALRFSDTARAKIEKSGGKCMTIGEIVKHNPEGKKVRIIG